MIHFYKSKMHFSEVLSKSIHVHVHQYNPRSKALRAVMMALRGEVNIEGDATAIVRSHFRWVAIFLNGIL